METYAVVAIIIAALSILLNVALVFVIRRLRYKNKVLQKEVDEGNELANFILSRD